MEWTMKTIESTFIACCLWAITGSSLAYNPITHGIISDYAVRNSVLNDPESGVTQSLGLGEHVDDSKYLLPSTYAYRWTLTPMRLIRRGVEEEDAGARALNHFFDPQNNGRALIYLLRQLGDSSPDWGLEDNFEIRDQAFSYKDAKRHLLNGLTASAKLDRDRELGRMFESLGHVIHLIQDKAQPQHVRNDIHCDQLFTPIYGSFLFQFPICPVTFAYRPSAYEAYTLRRGMDIPLSGYGNVDYGTYTKPRRYWESSGLGLAEFTSNNFVSIGTNFHTEGGYITTHSEYPFPSGNVAFIDKREITDPDLLGPQGADQPLTGEIWFVGTPVKDKYEPSESLNARTSTYSIFDKDLEEAGAEKVFSLNRFNYSSANDYLLPRATAYSIGMINYFFRGRIEISPPDEGVYSVLDHADTKQIGQGFTKLKVKLRNITPEGVLSDGSTSPAFQEMPDGALTAIAKYMVNPCYQPNLLGEYDGSQNFMGIITRNNCTLLEYYGGIEEISVSAEKAGQSLDRDMSEDFEFDFSESPIPINAHDLSIQIIYQGILGEENDAIVVSRRNISEPTWISVINGSDYFDIDGKFYTPDEIRADETLSERVRGANIDPEPLAQVQIRLGGTTVVENGRIPAKGYNRLAVLLDAEFEPPELPPRLPIEVQSSFLSGLQTTNWSISPIRNELAGVPGIISGVLSAINITRRGIPSWSSLYRYKALAGGPGIKEEDITALPPMEPSCFDGTNWLCVPDATTLPLVWQ